MPEIKKSLETLKLANTTDGPKPSGAQLAYMKLIEQENLKRVKKLELIRKRNWITGWSLGLCVLSIYGYTILTIKQERFLDDFNEPEKVILKKSE